MFMLSNALLCKSSNFGNLCWQGAIYHILMLLLFLFRVSKVALTDTMQHSGLAGLEKEICFCGNLKDLFCYVRI